MPTSLQIMPSTHEVKTSQKRFLTACLGLGNVFVEKSGELQSKTIRQSYRTVIKTLGWCFFVSTGNSVTFRKALQRVNGERIS
jgi:hypothetical protein